MLYFLAKLEAPFPVPFVFAVRQSVDGLLQLTLRTVNAPSHTLFYPLSPGFPWVFLPSPGNLCIFFALTHAHHAFNA
jgi:hypothetical protein